MPAGRPPAAIRTVGIGIKVHPEKLADLRLLAQKDDRPTGYLIREAITRYLHDRREEVASLKYERVTAGEKFT